MSEFTDFFKMKLTQSRRLLAHGSSNRLLFLDAVKLTRNLNVRVPVTTIAAIEILAKWSDASKAEIVHEMLESCIADSIKEMESQKNDQAFADEVFHHLEKNYGFELERDNEGNIKGARASDSSTKEAE